MIKLTPYLLFDGACTAAMHFYHSCLGGELSLTRVSESPIRDHVPPALHDKVLNARLTGPSVDISASDWMRPDQQPVQGNTVCLYFSGGTREELRSAFEALSDGAEVTDPLAEMPIGLYGALCYLHENEVEECSIHLKQIGHSTRICFCAKRAF